MSKRCPRSDILSLGNSQKSHGAKSGKYVEYQVVARYALSFWWNGHEERVPCETVHYRDAKITSFLPKISLEAVLSAPLEMPIVSARSLIVNRRFLCINSLIWLTFCLSVDVGGCPGAFQVVNTFSAFFEGILRHDQITEGILQHSERFRNWNFILQTKCNGTSFLIKFRL